MAFTFKQRSLRIIINIRHESHFKCVSKSTLETINLRLVSDVIFFIWYTSFTLMASMYVTRTTRISRKSQRYDSVWVCCVCVLAWLRHADKLLQLIATKTNQNNNVRTRSWYCKGINSDQYHKYGKNATKTELVLRKLFDRWLNYFLPLLIEHQE